MCAPPSSAPCFAYFKWTVVPRSAHFILLLLMLCCCACMHALIFQAMEVSLVLERLNFTKLNDLHKARQPSHPFPPSPPLFPFSPHLLRR